jgi:hypothetical protein
VEPTLITEDLGVENGRIDAHRDKRGFDDGGTRCHVVMIWK